jgi:hypothetical protein
MIIARQSTAPERLALLRSMPKHSVCAEVGVYQGKFSEEIIRTVEPRRLHLIDPWEFCPDPSYSKSWFGGKIGGSQAAMDRLCRKVHERLAEQIADGTVVIHRMHSAGAAAQFPDGYFDWVYIDANHTYDFVKQDLNAFYPKIRARGFLTGDNYGDRPEWWWRDGVKRAVDEFAASGKCDPPAISVDQFVMRIRPYAG